MSESKKSLSLMYKLLIIIMTSIGLYINFRFTTFQGGIVYFTLQSNLLCFIFYFLCFNLHLFGKLKKDKTYYMFKGMITTCIILTMFIYSMLELTNNINAYDGHLVECIFVHYLTPIMITIDYFAFDEKGKTKFSYPFIWSVPVIAYGVFNLIYTVLGGTFIEGKYAYSFFNVEKYGIFGVTLNSVLIFICFVFFGYIVYFMDKRLAGDK